MIVKKNLLEKRFRWSDNRRISIPNFREKIVQEVLRKLLSSIYEQCFNNHSHGFRPGRSCHTALRDIRKNFKECK